MGINAAHHLHLTKFNQAVYPLNWLMTKGNRQLAVEILLRPWRTRPAKRANITGRFLIGVHSAATARAFNRQKFFHRPHLFLLMPITNRRQYER